MGLYPPSYGSATLAELDEAGIAIVYEDAAWFIKFHQKTEGPYDTPQAALEASMHWLSESTIRQVGGNIIE